MKLTRIFAVVVGVGLPAAFGTMLAAAVLGYRAQVVRHAVIVGNTVTRDHYTHTSAGVLAVGGLCLLAWLIVVFVAFILADGFWRDWK